MSHAHAPFARWPLLAVCSLFVGCGSLIGLDELAYDLPGGGGAGATSTGGPASSSTGEATTTDASSSVSSSSGDTSSGSSGGDGGNGDGGNGGSGGEGGSPPTGFVVTGDRDGYTDYLTSFNDEKNVDVAVWHLDEAEADSTAHDGGEGWFDGEYREDAGVLTKRVPGVFADDHAVTFEGGARVYVEDQGFRYYPFQLRYTDFPFALVFFAKLDVMPSEPIVVASCIGDDSRGTGWRVKLSDEVAFEQHGSDFFGDDADEDGDDATVRAPFPVDGAWHFVVLTRQDAGEIRLYVDGEVETADTDVAQYFAYDGMLDLGGEVGDLGSGAVTLDEVGFFDAQMNNTEVVGLLDCLQGGTCIPPGN